MRPSGEVEWWPPQLIFYLPRGTLWGWRGAAADIRRSQFPTKLSHIDLHSFHVLYIHINEDTDAPEQHTILGGKVYVYKRPNSSLLQCETYFNRIIASDERSLVTLKPAAK